MGDGFLSYSKAFHESGRSIASGSDTSRSPLPTPHYPNDIPSLSEAFNELEKGSARSMAHSTGTKSDLGQVLEDQQNEPSPVERREGSWPNNDGLSVGSGTQGGEGSVAGSVGGGPGPSGAGLMKLTEDESNDMGAATDAEHLVVLERMMAEREEAYKETFPDLYAMETLSLDKPGEVSSEAGADESAPKRSLDDAATDAAHEEEEAAQATVNGPSVMEVASEASDTNYAESLASRNGAGGATPYRPGTAPAKVRRGSRGPITNQLMLEAGDEVHYPVDQRTAEVVLYGFPIRRPKSAAIAYNRTLERSVVAPSASPAGVTRKSQTSLAPGIREELSTVTSKVPKGKPSLYRPASAGVTSTKPSPSFVARPGSAHPTLTPGSIDTSIRVPSTVVSPLDMIIKTPKVATRGGGFSSSIAGQNRTIHEKVFENAPRNSNSARGKDRKKTHLGGGFGPKPMSPSPMNWSQEVAEPDTSFVSAPTAHSSTSTDRVIYNSRLHPSQLDKPNISVEATGIYTNGSVPVSPTRLVGDSRVRPEHSSGIRMMTEPPVIVPTSAVPAPYNSRAFAPSLNSPQLRHLKGQGGSTKKPSPGAGGFEDTLMSTEGTFTKDLKSGIPEYLSQLFPTPFNSYELDTHQLAKYYQRLVDQIQEYVGKAPYSVNGEIPVPATPISDNPFHLDSHAALKKDYPPLMKEFTEKEFAAMDRPDPSLLPGMNQVEPLSIKNMVIHKNDPMNRTIRLQHKRNSISPPPNASHQHLTPIRHPIVHVTPIADMPTEPEVEIGENEYGLDYTQTGQGALSKDTMEDEFISGSAILPPTTGSDKFLGQENDSEYMMVSPSMSFSMSPSRKTFGGDDATFGNPDFEASVTGHQAPVMTGKAQEKGKVLQENRKRSSKALKGMNMAVKLSTDAVIKSTPGGKDPEVTFSGNLPMHGLEKGRAKSNGCETKDATVALEVSDTHYGQDLAFMSVDTEDSYSPEKVLESSRDRGQRASSAPRRAPLPPKPVRPPPVSTDLGGDANSVVRSPTLDQLAATVVIGDGISYDERPVGGRFSSTRSVTQASSVNAQHQGYVLRSRKVPKSPSMTTRASRSIPEVRADIDPSAVEYDLMVKRISSLSADQQSLYLPLVLEEGLAEGSYVGENMDQRHISPSKKVRKGSQGEPTPNFMVRPWSASSTAPSNAPSKDVAHAPQKIELVPVGEARGEPVSYKEEPVVNQQGIVSSKTEEPLSEQDCMQQPPDSAMSASRSPRSPNVMTSRSGSKLSEDGGRTDTESRPAVTSARSTSFNPTIEKIPLGDISNSPPQPLSRPTSAKSPTSRKTMFQRPTTAPSRRQHSPVKKGVVPPPFDELSSLNKNPSLEYQPPVSLEGSSSSFTASSMESGRPQSTQRTGRTAGTANPIPEYDFGPVGTYEGESHLMRGTRATVRLESFSKWMDKTRRVRETKTVGDFYRGVRLKSLKVIK